MSLSFGHDYYLLFLSLVGPSFFPLTNRLFATFVQELELLIEDASEPCLAPDGKAPVQCLHSSLQRTELLRTCPVDGICNGCFLIRSKRESETGLECFCSALVRGDTSSSPATSLIQLCFRDMRTLGGKRLNNSHQPSPHKVQRRTK